MSPYKSPHAFKSFVALDFRDLAPRAQTKRALSRRTGRMLSVRLMCCISAVALRPDATPSDGRVFLVAFCHVVVNVPS